MFNGHVYNDSLDKAKVLNDYFTPVFTPVLSAPPPMDGPFLPDINPIQIDPDGIVELLKNLKTHKATGPNKIPAYLLKEANIEKGNHSLPNNYRPVSLTCICSKILEYIVYLHAFAHLSKHNILCDQQHGLWQSRSCKTQLIITINDSAESLNRNEQRLM